MAIRTELTLRLPNSPGALGGVCRALGGASVNILALSLEAGGLVRLVVDNPLHAAGVLRERNHKVAERDVLFVALPNRPGALAPVLALLADAEINIDYAYGGAGDAGGGPAVVIGVPDAQRAAAAAGV